MPYSRLYTALATAQSPRVLWICFTVTLLVGSGWLWSVRPQAVTNRYPITNVVVLQGPVIAAMESPAFVYAPDWTLSEAGADPGEPAEPWREPAGTLQFTYTGAELALRLAAGDYWGYVYVTVDGQPANLLPVLPANTNSRGQRSGYRTLYAPEQQTTAGPTPQWVRVHRAGDASLTHEVYIEVWRSWGQIPLRAVAIDGLSAPPSPAWPGVVLLLCAGWLLVVILRNAALPIVVSQALCNAARRLRPLLLPTGGERAAQSFAAVAILLLATGVLWRSSPLTLGALCLLAWCGLQRPALWVAALVLGLPFYYTYPLPILPTRSVGLIDIGILGGLVLIIIHGLLRHFSPTDRVSTATVTQQPKHATVQRMTLLLGGIVCWALLAAVEATHTELALREWRTVFLNGGLFALLLLATLRLSTHPSTDQQWILGGWIAGATLVALVGIWQYASNEMVVSAEGVQRVRGFYGSPNNLALYLERALAPMVALALFARATQWRWLAGGVAAILGGALLLTFSKGALLFGVPAMLAVLWLGGIHLLRQRKQSRRLLWLLAGIGGVAILALTPFLGTERFQRLLDFQQGTGFVRLQLWRSAWQMALDHPLFGVGPDNFLYAYRSFYLLPAAWQEPNLNHPHNWPLDWWTRLGLPGLLMALLWFVTLLRRHWRQLRTNRQPVLHLGLLAAGVAALAHGLIDASYALPDLMLIWILLTYMPLTAADEPPLLPG